MDFKIKNIAMLLRFVKEAMMKSSLKELFTLLFLITIFLSLSVICWAQFGGGQGTEQDPWVIESPEHLNNVRNYLGAAHSDKHYVQRANIDLGQAPWNEGQGWVPIGSTSTNSFRGTYNGNGHYVNGLTIDRGTTDYQALFGYTVGATITNLGLRNVNINARDYVAGLIGRQDGVSLVQGCYVTAVIQARNHVAGIVGYTRDATTIVQDCYANVIITANATSGTPNMGGIVGLENNGQVKRCFATGRIINVYTTTRQGGVIGHRTAGVNEHLYWNSELFLLSSGIGNVALPGQTTLQMLQQETYQGFDFDQTWRIDQGASFPYLRWEGETAPNHSLPPPLPPRQFVVTAASQRVDLSWTPPEPQLGVPDGYNVYRNGLIINEQPITVPQYQDTGLNNFVAYRYYVTSVFGQQESLPTTGITTVPYLFAGGSGTAVDPFLVSDPVQLHGVRHFVNSHFRQVANIDLGVAPWNEGEGWEPIGTTEGTSFRGTYDGNSHLVTGLTINNRTGNAQALFGWVIGGTLKNISLENVDITSLASTGIAALVGQTSGSVTNCYATGRVSGGTNSEIAGLIGGTLNSIVTDCWVDINLTTPASSVGLLIGTKGGTAGIVNNCYSKGSITVTANARQNIGGLIGLFRGTVNNSYSHATITVGENVTRIGGLVGTHNGVINNSYAIGLITYGEGTTVGGLTGFGTGQTTNSYWDIETTGLETSTTGQGRMTRQMIPPYDEITYVDWDFENIWQHDIGGFSNNGYPALHYQHLVPPIDPPVLNISNVTIENIDYIRLNWELVENALSYKLYATADIDAEEWGEPIRTLGENVTQTDVAVEDYKARFFRMTASYSPLR